MLGKGALTIKPLKKKIFLMAARLAGWYNKITFHATQQQEEHDVRSKFGSVKILVAPNVNAARTIENKSVKKENTLQLFYLSRISKVKNLHFALEILKKVPAVYKIEYDIFGNIEDADYWNECQKIIAQLPANILVNYKGELQFNEVQETISTYNCLFLPTLNENFGHSIVESLLCGCPVIISDQTPWTDVRTNDAGYAADLNEPVKFAEAIIACAALKEDEFRRKSKAAINYISKKINTQLISVRYEQLFNDCIKN
jgi:glycosyltransferase involved in cell wall biosynthesis